MSETTITVPAVYAALHAVQAELSSTGIGKNRRNQAQNFDFRGIDDMYNTITPLLVKHRLLMLPNYSEHRTEARAGNGGKTLVYASVRGTFTFVSLVDGSSCTVSTVGEAMDSGDKASNKAMAVSHKYAYIQALGIPTEGDNDPDASSHQMAPQVVRITADEAEFLKKGIRETGIDLAAYLTVFGVHRVEDIPAAAYAKAVSGIEAKRRANAKRATPAGEALPA